MTVSYTQKELNARFTYRADQGESWRILRDEGNIWGDCEDYSLTLVWLMAHKSMILFWVSAFLFGFVFWQCKAPSGEGHVVVWIAGYGWTDNIQRRPVSRADLKRVGYKLQYPILPPVMVAKFVLRPLLRRM